MDFYRVHLLCADGTPVPLNHTSPKAEEYLLHGRFTHAVKQAEHIATQIKLGNYSGPTADKVAIIEVRQHCEAFASVTCLYTVVVHHPEKR
jgi:hypothetical protein